MHITFPGDADADAAVWEAHQGNHGSGLLGWWSGHLHLLNGARGQGRALDTPPSALAVLVSSASTSESL